MALFKVHTVDSIEKVDGFLTPLKQTMQNAGRDAVDARYSGGEVTRLIGDDVHEAYLGR
jgi:hypothetical protein